MIEDFKSNIIHLSMYDWSIVFKSYVANEHWTYVQIY